MILRRCLAPSCRTAKLGAGFFTTLAVGHATKLLKKSGVDVVSKGSKSGRATRNKYGPSFQLRVDREKNAVVFDIFEVIGNNELNHDVVQEEKSLIHGRNQTIVLKYSDVTLPEEVFRESNRSLRFTTTALQQFQLRFSLDRLWRSFKRYEALEIQFQMEDYHDDIRITLHTMLVDTDALKRQPELESMSTIDDRTERELLAEAQGLIYVELDGKVGCIVNGAGLAMATNDILATYGSGAANFLDTGGQATTNLLVKAFSLLNDDPKVNSILVNIFGGVIDCGMIAESILRAANELDLNGLPIVVRLKGTNQARGEQLIRDSGLELFPMELVEEAAQRAIELGRAARTAPLKAQRLVTTQRRAFSTTFGRAGTSCKVKSSKYAIDAETRVIYQGFTGSVATSNAKATISYGTKVVGGVSPGKGGMIHLGLPVFDTVQETVEVLKPDATAIFVPALKAKTAILEAIHAKIPLIVSVAEGIPVHDTLEIHEALRESGESAFIGPNCPGIIHPRGKCRIGIMPYQQFMPGCIGIISKSGTLSYEAVAETTRHGLGQSLVLGIGGDMLPGTSMVDALAAILPREDTKGLILIGEIGGRMELEAADWIRANHVEGKPIVGFVAGHTAPVDRVMGHAGALRRADDLTAAEKCEALRAAGVVIVKHTGELGSQMRHLLGG